MNRIRPFVALLVVGPFLVPPVARAADYHHVHVTASNASEAVVWYSRYLDCQPVSDRSDAVDCGGGQVVFDAQLPQGGSQRTGIDHISLSYADLTAKMAELESVGVGGAGVRLQRFEDGSTLREMRGLFLHGFIFDPWGTRIELVEDSDTLGFHHIHLSSTDPATTLAWYQTHFAVERARLRDRIDGLRLGDAWLLAMPYGDGIPAPTTGRAVDHIAFALEDIDAESARLREAGVQLTPPTVVAPAPGAALLPPPTTCEWRWSSPGSPESCAPPWRSSISRLSSVTTRCPGRPGTPRTSRASGPVMPRMAFLWSGRRTSARTPKC